MRAFIYKINEETGKEIIPGMVSPEYKSYATLKRYYLDKHLKPGKYRVHCCYHWDWRYRDIQDTTHVCVRGV